MKGKAMVLSVLLCASFLVYMLSSRSTQEQASVIEGLVVPNIMLKDNAGKNITIESLKGTPLFLHFWASWCTTCDEEMPTLQALHVQNKTGTTINIITVPYRDKEGEVANYMKTGRYDFPVFFDENSNAAKTMGVTGVPETYLIDKTGTLFKKILGPIDWESAPAKTLINELIKRG
ncbi:MAG: TlpA family protein disulfide reductase [Candidatus Magnetoovum sp. WYHC-5]|nr:TlpA family protein disulfide reductase [Candidatus Magnetoovum sp. WYHC-5]